MNALWFKRVSFFLKDERRRRALACSILNIKTTQQEALLKKYHIGTHSSFTVVEQPISSILIQEARVAKAFWCEFRKIASVSDFVARTPHATDPINRLLDIGYHFLVRQVKHILENHNVPTEIGFFHQAHRATSEPLVYDIMEMFRADIVDREVLRFFRLKKKSVAQITQKDIGHFLSRVKQRLEHKYFLKEAGGCVSYKYYMELQILKIIRAVNHGEDFQPIHLPTRHDSRCS